MSSRSIISKSHLVLIALCCLIGESYASANETSPDPIMEEAGIIRRMPGNCSADQFDCGDKCIPMKRFRDCHQDCADGVDEACWPGFVRCFKENSACACVKKSDASLLCPERRESKFCSFPEADIFHCNNGNCIPKTWVNDRKNDCGDWSDEQISALQPAGSK